MQRVSGYNLSAVEHSPGWRSRYSRPWTIAHATGSVLGSYERGGVCEDTSSYRLSPFKLTASRSQACIAVLADASQAPIYAFFCTIRLLNIPRHGATLFHVRLAVRLSSPDRDATAAW